MSESLTLVATPRSVLGHKVKVLRMGGSIPATVYGKTISSRAVAVKQKDFLEIYKQTGETGLISLQLDKDARPVLVHHVQKNPVDGRIIHVEFLQVDLKAKVHTNVPVVIEGEAPAVAGKEGVLLILVDHVEVEALPRDLPDRFVADVSRLSKVDDEIRLKDISTPAGVTILTDQETVIARIGQLISREAEVETAKEQAVATAQVEEAPQQDGAIPTEEKPQA